MNRQSIAAKSAARRLWLWPIAILLGFPIGGLIADLTMDGVAWFVSSYVIARNIGERYPIFGASGCVVFGLLTWLLLAALIHRASEIPGTTNALSR